MLNFVPVVVHGKAADESQIDSRNGSQSNLNCSELQEAAYETLTSLAERSRKGDVPRPVLRSAAASMTPSLGLDHNLAKPPTTRTDIEHWNLKSQGLLSLESLNVGRRGHTWERRQLC